MTHETQRIGRVDEIGPHLGHEEREAAEHRHHRNVAALAYLYSLPAFFALRQRSEFVQGWDTP